MTTTNQRIKTWTFVMYFVDINSSDCRELVVINKTQYALLTPSKCGSFFFSLVSFYLFLPALTLSNTFLASLCWCCCFFWQMIQHTQGTLFSASVEDFFPHFTSVFFFICPKRPGLFSLLTLFIGIFFLRLATSFPSYACHSGVIFRRPPVLMTFPLNQKRKFKNDW